MGGCTASRQKKSLQSNSSSKLKRNSYQGRVESIVSTNVDNGSVVETTINKESKKSSFQASETKKPMLSKLNKSPIITPNHEIEVNSQSARRAYCFIKQTSAPLALFGSSRNYFISRSKTWLKHASSSALLRLKVTFRLNIVESKEFQQTSQSFNRSDQESKLYHTSLREKNLQSIVIIPSEEQQRKLPCETSIVQKPSIKNHDFAYHQFAVEQIIKKTPFEHLYSIGSVLGKGSFGQVRRCFDKATGDSFAIKIMEKTSNSSVNLQEVFVNEVYILSQLSHPNVVQLREAFEGDTKLYAILEYCNAGNLHCYILHAIREQQRREKMLLEKYTKKLKESNTRKSVLLEQLLSQYPGPSPETEIVQLLIGMLQPLAYLHSKHYAHRDIKTQNFLFSRTKSKNYDTTNTKNDQKTIQLSSNKLFQNIRVVLIDFGMSALVTKDSYLTTLCGTPHYLAPEILTHSYGYEVDMWAIGVIVYVMLYGRYPFDGIDRPSVLKKVQNQTLKFQVSSQGPSYWALDFAQRCLVRDPKKRMSAAEALKHSWLQPGVADEKYRYPIIMLNSPRKNRNVK